MSAPPVVLDLLVGARPTPQGADPSVPRSVSLSQADTLTGLARQAGVTVIRLLEGTSGADAVDTTLTASYLAGRHPDIAFLSEVSTTGNAPYNLARRVLSVDRATAGHVGLVLLPGDTDEVSATVTPSDDTADPGQRWTEYAQILTSLWRSFPRAALLGDQERALVVDDSLIRPIGHHGRSYRVAGPLDGPSSVQGSPVLVANSIEQLGWDAVAPWVDVVVVEHLTPAAADLAATAALTRSGRSRDEIAILGRRVVTTDLDGHDVAELVESVIDDGDGLVLTPLGGADHIADAVSRLHRPATGSGTLRSRLRLPAPVEVAA